MKKYLAKGLGIVLALSTIMAMPVQAADNDPVILPIDDVNGDGHVNNDDVYALFKYCLANPTATEYKLSNAKTLKLSEVNRDNDNAVTANDVALLLKRLGDDDATITLKITAMKTDGTDLDNPLVARVATTRRTKIIDLYTTTIGKYTSNTFYKNYKNDLIDRADNALFTVGEEDGHKIYEDIVQESIVDIINSAATSTQISAADFKAIMPANKEAINDDFIKNFPSKFSALYGNNFTKEDAEALAEEIKKSTKGNEIVKYNDVSQPLKNVVADLVKLAGYSTATVDDVINNNSAEGDKIAKLTYNGYTIIIEPTAE